MSPRRAAALGSAPRSQSVPSGLSRLIGRDEAVDEIERLLPASRLLTLTGAGGSGKTRLAAELARRAVSRGQHVVWTDLCPSSEPSALAGRVASTAGIREDPGRSSEEALFEAFGSGEALLVLDNCEHLVDGVAELVERLLFECRGLSVLATSREALRVTGERAWLVPPLDIPGSGASWAEGSLSGAIRLFEERASEVSRTFVLTPANFEAVARICRTLDGLPLALELAAARIEVLSPEQIAARLDDVFGLLGTKGRRGGSGHRTLRAAIDWSYSLLRPAERDLLARLSVFVGGFTLEGAEAVGSEPAEEADVLDLLSALVAKSLVVVELGGGTPRYRLLETVRQYALERLREVGREDDVRGRHAEHFLRVARDAESRLMASELEALDGLDPEHDNVRSALSWSRDRGRDEAIGLPLAACFHWYWYYRILWAEGRRWLEKALASTDPSARTASRAGALRAVGAFAWYAGEAERARDCLESSVEVWRELGDDRQLSYALALLPQLRIAAGDPDGAREVAEEAVAVARRSAWPYDVAYALTNGLALVETHAGQLEAADAVLAEAEAIWRRLGHPLGRHFVSNARARLALRAGDPSRAAEIARRALRHALDPPDPWFGSRSLRTLAYCEIAAGRPAAAARLLAASDEQLRAIGARVMPYEVSELENAREDLGRRLSESELVAAREEGGRLTMADALEIAGECRAETCCVAEEETLAASFRRRLVVRALGPLEISSGDVVLGGRWGGVRAKELLFLLLCHPRGCTKEEVGLALWPDASPSQVHNNFHVTLHRLRRALGEDGRVVVHGDRYRLPEELDVDFDARWFEAEVEAALDREVDEDGITERLECALTLYRGPLFAGEVVGDWHLEHRDRLETLYREGLRRSAEAHEEQGDERGAAEAYRRLLVLDDLDEEAARGLIGCLARRGARAEARRVYATLVRRLRDELDVDPDPETDELIENLPRSRPRRRRAVSANRGRASAL